MIFRFYVLLWLRAFPGKRGGLPCAGGGAGGGVVRLRGANNALPANAPTVTIGMDPFEPYCYLDSNGQYAGIDVDLATEAFSRLGVQGRISGNQLARQGQPAAGRHRGLPLGVCEFS